MGFKKMFENIGKEIEKAKERRKAREERELAELPARIEKERLKTELYKAQAGARCKICKNLIKKDENDIEFWAYRSGCHFCFPCVIKEMYKADTKNKFINGKKIKELLMLEAI